MAQQLRRRTRARGFNLIELLITVVIAGIVLAMAVPSFQGFVYNSNRASAVNETLGALEYARSEVLKRGRMVAVCATTTTTCGNPPDPATCTCSTTASDWGKGLLVYAKGTGTTTCAIEAPAGGTPDEILRYIDSSTANVSIIRDANTPTCYAFRSFSQPSNIPSGQTRTITFCDPRSAADASQRRAIVIDSVGRVRTYAGDPTSLTCP